jgi:hypothetical protein
MSEPPPGKPTLRTPLGRRWAERRAIRADRRARRKAKIGGNPEDAADIAGAAQMRGGFFTTNPGPRP